MQPFMRRPTRMLLGVALAALCLASAGVGRADSPVDQRMWRSTGLVEVPHPKGWRIIETQSPLNSGGRPLVNDRGELLQNGLQQRGDFELRMGHHVGHLGVQKNRICIVPKC